jgi:hypothetical protein
MTTRPTRLWWHLDDVLPIAEHALAAPERRLTRAQALAGSATQPALIWESEPDNDWLGSSGVPIWYQQDGTPHRVHARTWQHDQTGTLGTPGQLDGATGFLRLNRRYRDRDRTPLIKLLRRGQQTGGHWFVLDPSALHTSDGLRGIDHRDDIAPADATWIPATVICREVMDIELPAPIADGYTVYTGPAHLRPRHRRTDHRRPGLGPDRRRARRTPAHPAGRRHLLAGRRRPHDHRGRNRPGPPGPRRTIRPRRLPMAVVRGPARRGDPMIITLGFTESNRDFDYISFSDGYRIGRTAGIGHRRPGRRWHGVERRAVGRGGVRRVQPPRRGGRRPGQSHPTRPPRTGRGPASQSVGG